MQSRRIGEIVLSQQFMRVAEVHEVFAKLQFVPFRVEHMFVDNAFHMVGSSPLFGEVAEGAMTPRYEVIVSTKDDPVEGDTVDVTVK